MRIFFIVLPFLAGDWRGMAAQAPFTPYRPVSIPWPMLFPFPNISDGAAESCATPCVSSSPISRGPDPGRLLRKTARLAAQLNAQWYAVYVRTPSESALKIDATVQRQVADTLEAAQKMGGLVISLKHENVAQALISFAKEYGITHVVIGRPGKKALRLFGRALHDELIQELQGTDLVII